MVFYKKLLIIFLRNNVKDNKKVLFLHRLDKKKTCYSSIIFTTIMFN